MKYGVSTERSHSEWYAVIDRELGSTSFQIRTCDGPREMYIAPCGRHCHSGSVIIEASQLSALRRAASLMGRPR